MKSTTLSQVKQLCSSLQSHCTELDSIVKNIKKTKGVGEDKHKNKLSELSDALKSIKNNLY